MGDINTSNALVMESGSELDHISVVSSLNGVSITGANVSDVSVHRSKIVSAGDGVGTEISVENMVGYYVTSNQITASGYGVLLNLVKLGSRGIVISANSIDAKSDVIELNCPGAEFVGGVVNGNWLTYSGSSTTTGGFGIGVAAAEDIAIVGNSIQGPTHELIHIEDSHKGTSVVGNVGRGPGSGILLVPKLNAGQDQRPATIVGNNVASTVVHQKTGIELFWTNPSGPTGCLAIGNVVRDYGIGLAVGGVGNGFDNPGPVVNVVDRNSVNNCSVAMQMWGGSSTNSSVQVGTNLAENCPVLFRPFGSGNGTFGKIVSRTTPDNIFEPVTYTGMPFTCAGFAFPLPSFLTVNGSYFVYTFPESFSAANGTLYFHAQRSGFNGTWVQYWCRFSWNGSTLSLSDEVLQVGPTSTVTAVHLALNGTDRFAIVITDTIQVSYESSWLDVDGRIADDL